LFDSATLRVYSAGSPRPDLEEIARNTWLVDNNENNPATDTWSNAAAVRAQISQIEKYNTAVNTFYGKYGGLPGNISNAATFGFVARGTLPGQGNGNGIIEGAGQGGLGNHNGLFEDTGETVMFWVDVSTAGLIEGAFNVASPNVLLASNLTGTGIDTFFPQAKLGAEIIFTSGAGGWYLNGCEPVWAGIGWGGRGVIAPGCLHGIRTNRPRRG
jgi:hypothetical protein